MTKTVLRLVAYLAASGLLSGAALAQALTWQSIPGAATDIGVGPNGDAWVIGNDCDGGNNCGIYHLVNGTWSKVPGAARRIDVGPNGPWVTNGSGGIYRWNGRSWDQIPGAAWDIGIGASGAVWVIGTNVEAGGFGIYRWSTTKNNWDKIPGSAVRIDVDPQGNAWVVTSGNAIYRYNGSSFVPMPGAAIDIGIGGDGSVWVVGTDQGVHKWNGSTWIKANGALTNISVDGKGNPWGINSSKNIFASTSTPVDAPPPGVALAANGAEALTTNQWVRQGNYMLSPSRRFIGVLGDEGRFCVYESAQPSPASLTNRKLQPNACLPAAIGPLGGRYHMRLFADGSLCVVGGDAPPDAGNALPNAAGGACTRAGSWVVGRMKDLAPVARMTADSLDIYGTLPGSTVSMIDSLRETGKPEPFPAGLALNPNAGFRFTAGIAGGPATVTCPPTCGLKVALGDIVEIQAVPPPMQWAGNCANDNLVPPPSAPPHAAPPSCRLKMDGNKAVSALR